MQGLFFIMTLSALCYFGYAIAASKCQSFELQSIWSNKQLRKTATKCFEGRHVNQFIIIVTVFKYSFITLIVLMILQGIFNKIT